MLLGSVWESVIPLCMDYKTWLVLKDNFPRSCLSYLNRLINKAKKKSNQLSYLVSIHLNRSCCNNLFQIIQRDNFQNMDRVIFTSCKHLEPRI